MKRLLILAAIGVLYASMAFADTIPPENNETNTQPEKEVSLSVPPDYSDTGEAKNITPPNAVKSDVAGKGRKKDSRTAGPAEKSAVAENEVSQEVRTGLPPTTLDVDGQGQIAMPEITQRALLSNQDINRIVCREPIKDVFYSKEKGVTVDYTGNSAFVKLDVKKTGSKYEFVTIPIDLSIVCGNSIYTIIGFPKRIVSQTIRLMSGKARKVQENVTIFKDQSIKKKAQVLIKRARQDDLPDTFTTTIIDKPLTVFKDLQVVYHRLIVVDGEGLSLKEYYVTPLGNGMELNEMDFLRKEFVERPFALGFDQLKPAKGEKSRLFIVEVKAAAGEGDLNAR